MPPSSKEEVRQALLGLLAFTKGRKHYCVYVDGADGEIVLVATGAVAAFLRSAIDVMESITASRKKESHAENS